MDIITPGDYEIHFQHQGADSEFLGIVELTGQYGPDICAVAKLMANTLQGRTISDNDIILYRKLTGSSGN